MGKKGEFKRIAVLAIMMFFGMRIVGAYAVLPTMDQSKESEHAESQSTETHENKAEDDKNENKKQEAKNTGYGPFNSGDLFMDMVETAAGVISGDRFGKNYNQMLEKYAGELLKSQQLKSKKKKEELERQQEMREKLREEEKEKEKAMEEIQAERAAKPKKKWYNWYKSSSK